VPLAILLQEQLGILVDGVDKKLRRWDEATEQLVLVVDRLRSAYLVHWFGTSLPSVGIALRVGLANLHELRARWLAVGGPAAGASAPAGPNLTEPLLGAGGVLVGAFASPLNGILLTTAIGSLVRRWWAVALAIVNWLSGGLLFAAAGAAGGVAIGLGIVPMGIAGEPRDLFDLLGAAAELPEPLLRFWQQVSGPRDAVRNPLLRQLLVLGDRVAALTSFLLGAFAVLVTRIGPVLEPLRLGLVAVYGLAVDLAPLIVLAVGQVVELVSGLVGGPASVPALLRGVVAGLSRALVVVGRRLRETFAWLRDEGRWVSGWGSVLVDWWWAVAEPAVRAQTVDHPTVRYLRSFAESLGAVSAWRARTAPAAPPGPPSPPGTLSRVVGWVLHQTGMPTSTPRLPALPSLPPLVPLGAVGAAVRGLEALRGLGLPVGPANPFEPGVEARRVLARAGRPPSVFAGEWAALEQESRNPAPLARTLEAAAYLAVARRVVGPAAASAVRGLEDVLSQIDATIRTERGRRQLPVRDVPEPARLAPAIVRLRVRSRGRTAEAVQAWVEDLRRELNAADYAVPVGG
jgi:hypothetical protein